MVFVQSKLDVGDGDNSDRNTSRWTQNVQKFGIKNVVDKFTINVAQICYFFKHQWLKIVWMKPTKTNISVRVTCTCSYYSQTQSYYITDKHKGIIDIIYKYEG